MIMASDKKDKGISVILGSLVPKEEDGPEAVLGESPEVTPEKQEEGLSFAAEEIMLALEDRDPELFKVALRGFIEML